MEVLISDLWIFIFEHYLDVYTLRTVLTLCRESQKYAKNILRKKQKYSLASIASPGFLQQYCIKRIFPLCFNFAPNGNLLMISLNPEPRLRTFNSMTGVLISSFSVWSPSVPSLMLSRQGDLWIPAELGDELHKLILPPPPSLLEPTLDASTRLTCPFNFRAASYDEDSNLFLFLHNSIPEVAIISPSSEVLCRIRCEDDLSESVLKGQEHDGYTSHFVLNTKKKLMYLHKHTAVGDTVVIVPYHSCLPSSFVGSSEMLSNRTQDPRHISSTRTLLQRPTSLRGQISSIAVDSNGRIFATSERQLHVAVFDQSGKYEMSLLDREDILDSWLLRVREDGKLFVLGQVTGQVFIL